MVAVYYESRTLTILVRSLLYRTTFQRQVQYSRYVFELPVEYNSHVLSVGGMNSVREALWGKGVQAFDQSHPLFVAVQMLGRLRRDETPLSYGRLYFREVSGNGQDFGLSKGIGGVLAFSRILAEREVLIVSNTNTTQQFQGWVVVDLDLGRSARTMQVAYSNLGTTGTSVVQVVPQARFYKDDGTVDTTSTAALFVILAPMEILILVPA
jgi:hypothetical protein